MPLSDPVPREPLHARKIEMNGYLRDDGLWDIEGRLVDTKTYSFENQWRGEVAPGVPVHEMRVRLTIDDDRRVHACEAVSEHYPFPLCPRATPSFAELTGLRVGPGWMREVRRIVGGTRGCTHIVEMLAQMATVAFQTQVAKDRLKGKPDPDEKSEPPQGKPRPPLLDSCHALASDGEVVEKLMPEWYTGGNSGKG